MDLARQDQLSAPTRLEVAGFAIDFVAEALLDASGNKIELRPQAFQVLRHLAINADRLVTKEELLASVWAGTVVTDDSLVQAIGDVRRAFGRAGRQVIRTVPRRGYVLQASAVGGSEAQASNSRIPKRPFSHRALQVVVLAGVMVPLLLAVALWHGSASRDPLPARARDDRPSVSVLAFKAEPGDPEGHVLGRGVAADLVSELARAPELRVMSTYSSFHFAGSHLPLTELGRQLHSRYIVDGTVRRVEENLLIGIQLIDSTEGHVIWSSSHTVDHAAMGAVQQALVSRIAGTLQSRVYRTEEQRSLAKPPKTLDVYVQVEYGKEFLHRYSAEGMRNAREFFERALSIDPDYAPAWVFLGITNTVDIGLRLSGEWGDSRIGEAIAQIRRGIALQPELPNAHVALSQAQAWARDFHGALKSAEQTCKLSPNDSFCFYILGKAQLELVQCAKLFCTYRVVAERAALARATFARMSEAVAVQMNGLGCAL